jgi:predicted transcriptional regulator
MVERKTIRPITLRRIIEICSLAVQSKGLTVEIVSDKLNSTKSRSKEILLEVEKMGLLNRSGELWIANDYTTYFIKSFEKEEWNKIHQYFLENYQFYKEFIQILKNHINDLNGISIEDIVKESTDSNLHLNKTAVEVLTDWCERLGIIQRNLYTAKIYLIKEGSESLDKFVNTLLKCYRKITLSKWYREVFVEIPLIRENICEELKISRKVFDDLLKEFYLKNIGKVEFSGAPITTIAKKSPLSEKRIIPIGKDAIMSANSSLKKEREGIMINKKSYYYLAIHENI